MRAIVRSQPCDPEFKIFAILSGKHPVRDVTVVAPYEVVLTM